MPEDPTKDFGAFLRQARERQGLTLRQIADRTKISMLALEALERNDISRLPGGLFTRAFVRAYAGEIGLPREETVRRFLARFPEASLEETPVPHEAEPTGLTLGSPASPSRGWRVLGWLLPLLLVIAYFGLGGRLPFLRDQPPARVPSSPNVNPAVPPPPAPPAPDAPAAAGDFPAAEQAESPPPVTPQAGGAPAAGDPAVLPAGAEAAASEAADAPAQATTPEGTLRLTLAPREDCWVSVRAGAAGFSALMRAGTRRELDLAGEITLHVGNAGALAFSINGEPGRALGNPGQVVTVRFDASNYRDFLEPR